MSGGGHLERLEAFCAAWDSFLPGTLVLAEGPQEDDPRLRAADLRAALDELKQLRAEREADDSGAVWLAERNEELRNAVTVAAELAGMGRISWHGAAPQQPERGGSGCPCGCPVVEGMCSCPEPCLCEPDCAYCLVPNPMREPERGGEANCNPECREAHAGQPH